MTKRKWIFDIEGKSHEVLLKFGLISGRQIWLDGNLINKGRRTFEFGSEYNFLVDGFPAQLGIISTPASYEFYLRIENEFVFSKDDKRKKVGKYTLKKFEDLQKWIDLGNKHGLQYFPIPNQGFAFQHRFIGYLKGLFVVISFAYRNSAGSSVPGFYILVKHSPIDTEKAKEIKNNEEIKKTLKELRVHPEWLEIEQECTTLFITSGMKKENEYKSIDDLVKFFYSICKYVKPPMPDKCEGSECASPYHKELTLIFINRFPLTMCRECIARIDDINKKAEEEYKKQPDNLLVGSLYGLVAMFIGAIVWALIQIFLDRIGAVFAVLIFFFIVKAMDYAKTKRTFKSLFVAAILSLAGSVIGTYIGFAGYLFREGKFEIKLNEFIWLAKKIIDNPELISDTIFFSLIGLVPYLFITWNANRSNLKKHFKPDIELIKNFELKH
jgi:hypothetical protein